MPIMDGLTFCRTVRLNPKFSGIPFVAMSSESDRFRMRQMLQSGAATYIVKPFKGEQLIGRADKLINLKKHGETDTNDAKSAAKDIFTDEKELVVLTFPPKITRSVGARVDSAVKRKIKEMLALGIKKMIVDLSPVIDVNMSAIQVIISLANNCINNKISARIVADENQSEALKGFQETSQYSTQPSIEHARAAF
jgi:CheY-like chemotaxis protein